MSVERSTLTADIRERLDTLRQMSKLLEPDAQSRNAALGKVAEYTDSFLEELASRPVYQPPGDASNALDALAITEVPPARQHGGGILTTPTAKLKASRHRRSVGNVRFRRSTRRVRGEVRRVHRPAGRSALPRRFPSSAAPRTWQIRRRSIRAANRRHSARSPHEARAD